MQRLGDGEQKEHRPRSRVSHSAVQRQHELDPVTDAEPIDDAGRPAEEEAAYRPGLTGESDKEWRQGDRGEKRDVPSGENQNEEDRRDEREQSADHEIASSATPSAI